ncbi:MAG TPA: ribonuclease J [Sphingomonadaceae bacterium]|nr:ribonuclease J [Sphingomonadaceae bacterium]
MTPSKELLFLALGGSGEIGMNVNLYGCDGKWVMVDLGMTFADPNYPGIDLILPDLSFIEERRKDLLGIVLTHGHEDHIGAIPYLAAELGVPLYATPFTAGLIAGKLEEEGLFGKVKLKIVELGGSIKLGSFDLRYVPMAHSIPESNALLIQTPYGNVFHSGDWKLDPTPQIGTPATPAELTVIGDIGIRALVCDSTNIFSRDASGSEATVRTGLDEVVAAATGRVMVTTFASNGARLQTLGQVAADTGRTLCVAGRSLNRILKVAQATGYLENFPETVDFDTAMRLPRKEVLIVGTGGQGEDRAALSRVAFDSHPLKLEDGDTVIFSSRQIPGNEVAIGRIQNELARRNIIIVTERQGHVHVSGHPGRPELADMYKFIRPEVVVPVHGEMRHLAEHARFALTQGVPESIRQENGDLIRLAPGKPKTLGKARVGRLILDGDVILPADGATMNERRKLAVNGLVAVAMAVDAKGKMRGKVQIRIEGLPVEEDRDDFLADASQAASQAVAKGAASPDKLTEAVRLAVRKSATTWTGKKPVVEVLIVRVP